MRPATGFCGLMRPGAAIHDIDSSTGPFGIRSDSDGLMWCGAWQSPPPQLATASCIPGVLAFQGEIFNQREVVQALGLHPHTPITKVLEAGFKQWGTALFDRIEGVCAIAIRDGNDLLLFRDASAMSSLYAQPGPSGQLAFSTHLDTLLSLPGTRRKLSRHALHEYLRFLDISAPRTIYSDVVAVRPGQLLRWNGQRWIPEERARPASDLAVEDDLQAALASLEQLLEQSLRCALTSADRPAAFLSGGIDSALVCAFAAGQRRDIVSVTVGFKQPDHDESHVAARVAQHLGLRHEVLRFSHAEYLDAFERLARHMDQPMADPATPATLLALECCRDRFDVMLDGTGADEALGLMPPRHVRWATGYASLLPRVVRAGITKTLRSTPWLSGHTPMFDFEHPAETMMRWKGFSRSEISTMCGEDVSFDNTHFFRTFEKYPRWAHFERYSALLNAMPCERLTQAALVSGMHLRYPFLDARVDRFLRQLDPALRFQPRQPKRILRELLARRVPRQLWDRPKHGFNFPLYDFLAADEFALVRQHLDKGVWQQHGVVSAEYVAGCANQFMAGDRSLTFRVWALVMLGAWLERHVISTATSC